MINVGCEEQADTVLVIVTVYGGDELMLRVDDCDGVT